MKLQHTFFVYRRLIGAAVVTSFFAGFGPHEARAQEAPRAEAPKEAVDLLPYSPNGITAEQVGIRAAQTSFTAKASQESLRAAAARVDGAWSQFLPKLVGTARYTRLSDFTPPSLGFGSGSLVVTQAPPGTVNPPGIAQSLNFAFPIIVDNYLLQASITVPISDYFLRINQNYTAATHAQDAARYDTMVAKAKSDADGRVAFYTWLRSRGAVFVAEQALSDQQTHLRDAKNQFEAGNASRADVLRAETAVSSAVLQVERSKNLADLSERQVRIALHAKPEETFVPGERLDAPLAFFSATLPSLVSEAMTGRYEIKSTDANARSAREQASVQRAGNYPVLSGFADGIYANPNQRRVPQANEWFGSWDLGAQVVWSPNDIVLAGGGAREAEARAAALDAQKQTVREGIELEVMQAYQGVKESEVALQSTHQQLASATEAHRVARELFLNGRGTSTTLTDAETEVTRARLDTLNASVDARVSRVRLDHALGRDVKQR